jgi:glycosyltransferase involved in cell wall biosynthesis
MGDVGQQNDSGRTRLSVFIICRNEEQKIGSCLESVKSCTDIVVVDSGSTDTTLQIVEGYRARGLAIRVFQRTWNGYAEQKQYALDQCREDWCLNLDADERIDAALAAEIAKVVASPTPHRGFRLPLLLWLPGRGYPHPWTATEYFLRLVRRDSASYDLALKIHEGLRVDGPVGKIRKGSILHRQEISPEEEAAKLNRYSSLKVAQRIASGRRAQPWRMCLSPIGYFLRFYLVKRYVLNGWAGFSTSFMNAQYAFLTEWKHWRSTLAERNADDDPRK